MLDTINQFFGFTKTDYADLVKKGAIVLDVRSKGEFASGHVKNSINIPPTAFINQGQLLNIMVARDVDFAKVYDLVDIKTMY